MGDFCSARKKYAEAEKEYRQALQADPTRAKSHLKLGAFYMAQGREAEAEPFLLKAVALDPDELLGFFYLARRYLAAGQNLERAEQYFRKYLSKVPEEGTPPWFAAHWRLGQVYESSRSGIRPLRNGKKLYACVPTSSRPRIPWNA